MDPRSIAIAIHPVKQGILWESQRSMANTLARFAWANLNVVPLYKVYIYMLTPPPMIHPNDGPSLLQSVWAQVQTIFYVKQTELVQKNK